MIQNIKTPEPFLEPEWKYPATSAIAYFNLECDTLTRRISKQSKMLTTAPCPSMRELMLAGHSASSCDLSIPVEDLTLDVQALEPTQSRQTKGLCSDGTESFLPAPRKFCKKSSDHGYRVGPIPHTSSIEIKRAIRQLSGSAIAKEEAAHWTSCAQARQVSATKVSKLLSIAESDC